jgi:hypothetical protein
MSILIAHNLHFIIDSFIVVHSINLHQNMISNKLASSLFTSHESSLMTKPMNQNNASPGLKQVAPFTACSTSQAPKSASPTKVLKVTKRVCFTDVSTGVVLRPKTPQDRKNAWLTKQDIKGYRRNVPESAKLLLETNPHAAKAYIEQTLVSAKDLDCQRFSGVEHVCGLEHILSHQIYQALCVARVKTRSDVLREQARQRSLGINDVESLALVSRQATKFPQLWHNRIAVMNCSDGSPMSCSV